jgi:hypothetical protein
MPELEDTKPKDRDHLTYLYGETADLKLDMIELSYINSLICLLRARL